MSTSLKPFFCYYGGKWRAAPTYPEPRCNVIIEPFAGAAGYSLRYADRRVSLYDADPLIAELWAYLIHVSAVEILSLPERVDHVDDVKGPEEARWLVGFWLNKGTTEPRKTPSKWMRDGWRPDSMWGPVIRERIASQVERIRHWRCCHGSFTDATEGDATWFIDPPYSGSAGRHYRHNAVDFEALGVWCRSRSGQVIVCEQAGASWLPFRRHADVKGMEGTKRSGRSAEVIWTNDPPEQMALFA